MLKEVKCWIRKIKYANNKKCYFSKDCFFDEKTILEGHNSIKWGTKLNNVAMGIHSYISYDVTLTNTKIGKFSCIGPFVKNVIGNHPTRDFVSIHPAFFSTHPVTHTTYVKEQRFDEISYVSEGYNNVIGNDVWIGGNVTIIGGVSIGDGAIIAAGSVVNQDVPDYAIYGGVPAKLIRYRFTDEQIHYLQELKWWEKNDKWLTQSAPFFSNVDDLMKWSMER